MPPLPVLVTGGAGYIGSHVARALLEAGFAVTVLDDLSQGHAAAVPGGAGLVIGDVADEALLDRLFTRCRFHAVMHLAGRSLVGESMRDPFPYLEGNTTGGIRLIRACARHGVTRFVLSSTMNLFEAAGDDPIGEAAPIRPASPYGEGKAFLERSLAWAEAAAGIRSACLRYGNVAGAHPDGDMGEDHAPETHLIPILLEVAAGRRRAVEIFGDDFPTADGTCIRDYIHVCDVAGAHLRVLDLLDRRSCRYNVGTGTGHSVRSVLETARRVTGHPIPARISPRRPGDPPSLVADPGLMVRDLGWSPRLSDLDTIIATAWNWRRRHPEGYASRAPRAAAAGTLS
ncbi:MAG TPA: UDP-glucose 4-epimerase GalE [Azospirillaceae bacterium]|nr:UDP-glucose 4-epimerase GalE [Azospirillaceae bacterium]